MNTHHSIMKLLLNPTQVSIKPLYDLCLLFCVIAYIDHQCKYPGCSNVLVIDGNLKNRRAVCAASEAGYLQYPGVCGTIKSGCQLTPLQTSKYCYNMLTEYLMLDRSAKITRWKKTSHNPLKAQNLMAL